MWRLGSLRETQDLQSVCSVRFGAAAVTVQAGPQCGQLAGNAAGRRLGLPPGTPQPPEGLSPAQATSPWRPLLLWPLGQTLWTLFSLHLTLGGTPSGLKFPQRVQNWFLKSEAEKYKLVSCVS